MKKTLIIITCLLIAHAGVTKTYFVSKRGSDDHTGTIFYPFKTINKAVEQLQAGDTLVVLPGIYSQTIEVTDKKGTLNKPIVIMAKGDVVLVSPDKISRTDPAAIIQGKQENISDGMHPFHPFYLGGVIRVEHSDYVTIDGFNVKDSPWMGISALECKNLTIQNNLTDNTMASGIYILWSYNVKVLNNEIRRACGYPTRVSAGGPQGHGTQEFLSVVSCDGFEVAYNVVHESNIYSWTEGGGPGSGGEGIDVKEHSANGSIHHNYVYNLQRLGLYVDAWNAKTFKNVEVYNNIVHDCLSGISVGAEDGGTVENVRFYNNLVFNITWQGFGLASWGHNGEKKDIWIFNNTFHNCGSGGISLGDERNKNIYIYNNISFENGRGSSRHGSMDNPDLNEGKAKNVKVKNNLFGVDPGFMDISRYNYRLKPDSKAIDAGIDVQTFGLDLDDHPRVNGKSIDIGPFEFNAQ